MTEWIGAAALVPLLMCGGMMVFGAVAAFFGFRRGSGSAQDATGTTPGDDDEWTDWFDGPPNASPLQRMGDRR